MATVRNITVWRSCSGAVVLPLIQSARTLSLELMSFDVAPQQDLYTRQGVAVNVEAVAQIKVKSDPDSIRVAAEQLLTKSAQEREGLIRLVMEGHLRGIVGQLTVEEIVKQPEMVAGRMRENVAGDMDKMGLEVISFTIREVRDNNEYILNPTLDKMKDDVVKRSYKGVDYRFDRNESTAAGVFDHSVVVGTEPGFKSAVDASKGDSLADSNGLRGVRAA